MVGISAFYHDSACCLLRDGELVAAAQEERFSRVKNEARLPIQAFLYCLREGGIGIDQVDCVAYYELPELRAERQSAFGQVPVFAVDPVREIRERLGFAGRIELSSHHASHAASTFLFSDFDEAAILTADGVGEWTTTGYWRGSGTEIECIDEVRFPHSLGLWYSTVTDWLGFPVNQGEGTVMALAGHGEPRYVDQLRKTITVEPGPGFRLEAELFDFRQRMSSPRMAEVLKAPRRSPGAPITPDDADLAHSLQVLLEEIVLEKLRWLRETTGCVNLCLAGGVALNCVLNGRIEREGIFDRVFVQPAAGDAGGALGAAALAHVKLAGERPRPLGHVYLGPEDLATDTLAATPLQPESFLSREAALLTEVTARLERGEIGGWVQGRLELGPRALGGRSILADPRVVENRHRLNREIKRRELFRPFGASILEGHAGQFEDWRSARYMLVAGPIESSLRSSAEAVLHVDRTTRAQVVGPSGHPRFYRLLQAWHCRTGCPMLLNTSFNGPGEPIVNTTVDALFAFVELGLDFLVVGDGLVDRVPHRWHELFQAWNRPRFSSGARNLYTF